MDINEEWKQEFLGVYPNARFLHEGGFNYIYLPDLKMPQGIEPEVLPALLCISFRDGYDTRLYLPQKIIGKELRNWNSDIYLMDSNWHSFSWTTQPGLSYLEMIMVNLTAFKK